MTSKWIRAWWAPVIATLAAFVALASWAVSSPVGSSPDEDFHLASIWCSPAARGELCEPGTKSKNRDVSVSIAKSVACYAEDETKSAKCQEQRDVFNSQKRVVTERGNFVSKYPPVFYAAMSVFAGPDVQTSVIAMRLFNIALFCGLTLAAWVLISRRQRFVLGAAWLVTLVPLGEFILASINPSSWTLTGAGTLFIAALEIFALVSAGNPLHTERRRFIGLLVVAGLALVVTGGSRADGAFYGLLAIATAFVIARAWRRLGKWTYAVAGGAVAVTSVFLFLTRNAVFNPSSLSAAERNLGEPGRSFAAVLGKNVLAIPELLSQFFGTQGLGWLDTGMPAITTVGATVVFVAVMSYRLVQAQRLTIWILGAGTILLIAVPLVYLQVRNAFVGESFQARYLLPLVVILAVVALSGGSDSERPEQIIPRRIAWLATPVLIVANTFALYANMSRYVQGGKASSWNLNDSQWWWVGLPSPMIVWMLGSVTFAIAAVLVMWPALRASVAPAATPSEVPPAVSKRRARKVSP
jgi:hypothetical protein